MLDDRKLVRILKEIKLKIRSLSSTSIHAEEGEINHTHKTQKQNQTLFSKWPYVRIETDLSGSQPLNCRNGFYFYTFVDFSAVPLLLRHHFRHFLSNMQQRQSWESLPQVENHCCSDRPRLCVKVRTHTCRLKNKRKKKNQEGQVTGFWHTHTSAACALLTLPFALVVCKASGGGGVVSLGLRRRPFSWPLSASEEPSLPSARFLARSVFHERDFLYGTGTTETSTGQSERSCAARCRRDAALRCSSTLTAIVKEQQFYVAS